ncbi:MAG: hypothetical protein ABJA75_11775 [Bradyrhizobium sp.]
MTRGEILHMSPVENEDVLLLTATKPPKVRPRRLGAMFVAVFTAQYLIIAICVGLSVAGTLHYQVTPQIVARFEAIATALKR